MTHNDRVLALLSDGEPHGHMEGYRLGVMLHSRVSDLRKRGHTIECWREGDDYLYQLTSPGYPCDDPPVAADGTSSVAEAPPVVASCPGDQLSLVA